AMMARPAASRVVTLARHAWSGAATADAATTLGELVPAVTAMVVPVALGAFAAALIAGLAQTRMNVAWGAIGQRRDEPEPWAATSFAAAAAIVLLALGGGRALVGALVRAEGWAATVSVTAVALSSLTVRALVVVALAGLGESAWRRTQLAAALSMSRAEAERERRQDEGDPRLRAEQRRRQRAVARDPLVDEVARAELVVTADGVAVALRLADGEARIAAAAGDDRLRAQRLADVARRLGIAVRADDELAAALAHLPAGAAVPPALQTRSQLALRAVRRAVTTVG
ncbi:MAG: EscU/YscU/HrcU family type III secretion system export apparatus switch protein, partial [Myxococcales bacterium]|nr:EscU/YscU/HrcU family type III secretion system export apparatus switch protein [Myxococcales bacterium]